MMIPFGFYSRIYYKACHLLKVLTSSTNIVHNFQSPGSPKLPQANSALQGLVLLLPQDNEFNPTLMKSSFPWFLCCFASYQHIWPFFSIFAEEASYKMVYKFY